MKVFLLIDTLETGGAETSILEIASGLRNWNPVVIQIYPGETLKPRFEKAGIKVYSLNVKAKFGIREGVKKLSKIIEKEKPDLIHATLFKSEIISRIVGPKYKIPVINSFVNDTYSKERYKLLNVKQSLALKLYEFVDKITAPRVNKFMSITNSIIPNYAEVLNINPSTVDVIYRGRDIEGLRGKIDVEKVKELQQLYGQGPIILTVSRLLIRKGYDESIRAMEKVISLYPEVKYLIAGEGHDRSKFERLISKLGLQNNIFLLGNRNDVPSLMAFSNIFLFPSHYEGQGGALVEAMIQGMAIISSKISVIEESVKDNHSALLFEPKNVDDITSKILYAIKHPSLMKSFGDNAKAEAEKRFNIKEVAEKHEKLYFKVSEKYEDSPVLMKT